MCILLSRRAHTHNREIENKTKSVFPRKFTRLDQVMCLNWLESNQSLQWLGLAFNTFVHVIMYVRHDSLFIISSLPVCRVIDFVFFERAPSTQPLVAGTRTTRLLFTCRPPDGSRSPSRRLVTARAAIVTFPARAFYISVFTDSNHSIRIIPHHFHGHIVRRSARGAACRLLCFNTHTHVPLVCLGGALRWNQLACFQCCVSATARTQRWP